MKRLVWILLAIIGFFILIYLLIIAFTPRTGSNNQSGQTSGTNPAIFSPMTKYADRVTAKPFGKEVSPSDRVGPCGASFSGFHTGDDLEILPGEENTAVPFFAIADGTVAMKDTVSGYGGLLVILQSINGELVTTYYGHVDLDSIGVKVGDAVTAGQMLGKLAPACSDKSGGERKHLHFGIHKGPDVDTRGYVPDQASLGNWFKPSDFLKSNNASEPKQ